MPTTGSANKIKLYSHWNSVCTERVRIALNLKKLQHDLIPLNVDSHAAIVKINPMHQVPALVHNGKALAESMAILHYLDRVFPEPRLFPDDPYTMGKVMNICEIVNSHLQPQTGFRVFRQLREQFNLTTQQKTVWATHFLELGLSGVEAHLRETAGDFSVGNSVSAADCYVVPQAFQAELYLVDLSKYPRINSVFQRCRKIPAFEAADVLHQVDTPPGTTANAICYVTGDKNTGIK
jgi:maleylacetoacetate isomerase